MTSRYVLEVQHIAKKIGKKQIIQDASFQVAAGRVVGLLGPNGAGKTTIIRMLVGLMSHDQGEIAIMNYSVRNSFKEAMTHVGAIVENPEFYNYMSGRDNLLQYARMAKRDISAQEMDAIIKQVHLENNIQDKVKTYSLGMRQRLGVAQALLHQPELLVLDEPMNGLDPKGMKEFREMILQLKNQGVGVLVSSHLLSDMELLCDDLVIVQRGQITHTGPMKQNMESKLLVLLDTTNQEKAAAVLKDLGYSAALHEGKYLKLELVEDTRAQLLKQLIAADVDVLELRVHEDSLEENFLRWTEEGGL